MFVFWDIFNINHNLSQVQTDKSLQTEYINLCVRNLFLNTNKMFAGFPSTHTDPLRQKYRPIAANFHQNTDFLQTLELNNTDL